MAKKIFSGMTSKIVTCRLIYDVYSNKIWIHATILCCAIVPSTQGKIDKSKLLCSTIRNAGNFGEFIICSRSFDKNRFMYIYRTQ